MDSLELLSISNRNNIDYLFKLQYSMLLWKYCPVGSGKVAALLHDWVKVYGATVVVVGMFVVVKGLLEFVGVIVGSFSSDWLLTGNFLLLKAQRNFYLTSFLVNLFTANRPLFAAVTSLTCWL